MPYSCAFYCIGLFSALLPSELMIVVLVIGCPTSESVLTHTIHILDDFCSSFEFLESKEDGVLNETQYCGIRPDSTHLHALFKLTFQQEMAAGSP